MCLIILILCDSTRFWNLLRGMNRTGISRFCNISINHWFNHFPALFETNFENERSDSDNTNPLLNGLNQTKIIKKNLILFWLLNMM